MRKNKAMRLASVLLIAVLLTTCVISGTFAKYVSSANSSDKARVAKWGFDDTTTIDITDLFAVTYEGTLNGATADTVNGNGDDVIAPGTYGSAMFAFENAMSAAPEVAYSIKVDTTGSSIHANIAANPNILWALDATDVTDPGDAAYGTWADLLTAIEDLSEEDIAPNTLPTEFGTGATHTISWIWVFYTTEGDDIMDTNMGNIEANSATALQEVELKITITATQVD